MTPEQRRRAANYEEQDEEDREPVEASSIDAEAEENDEGIAADVVQSHRASPTLADQGRLLADQRLVTVEEHWYESGYCPYCPLEVAGLCEPGNDVPTGGPFLERQGNTWVRAPRSEAIRNEVRRHLRDKHAAVYATIVAGGELPPFNTDVTAFDNLLPAEDLDIVLYDYEDDDETLAAIGQIYIDNDRYFDDPDNLAAMRALLGD
ncbi:uncharacterized protein SRS1_06417 [Sporisorium reilianum f. sp. reilianum]|uniref:Uncharacterized protein n=1 Tax=Sporisorium reilianum f. sp. reilianum TaxID=72559 RepID=A0A2N8U5R9_9BASI|nr:uncharacterized protein SRS1_06417 [Sporisorium reilianum f. sp. reilianum]